MVSIIDFCVKGVLFDRTNFLIDTLIFILKNLIEFLISRVRSLASTKNGGTKNIQ